LALNPNPIPIPNPTPTPTPTPPLALALTCRSVDGVGRVILEGCTRKQLRAWLGLGLG